MITIHGTLIYHSAAVDNDAVTFRTALSPCEGLEAGCLRLNCGIRNAYIASRFYAERSALVLADHCRSYNSNGSRRSWITNCRWGRDLYDTVPDVTSTFKPDMNTQQSSFTAADCCKRSFKMAGTGNEVDKIDVNGDSRVSRKIAFINGRFTVSWLWFVCTLMTSD